MSINNETRPFVDPLDIKFGDGLLTWLDEVVDLPPSPKNESVILVNSGREAQVINGPGIDVYEKNLALRGMFLLKRSEAAPTHRARNEEVEQL